HAAAESRTDQTPKPARQKSELRRQHRPDQRPWPGDGSEMMSKNHPAVRRHEIFAVVLHQSGSGALVIKQEHFAREPLRIETITDREGAQPRDDNPERVNLLSPAHRQNRDRPEPKQGDRDAEQRY